MWGYGIHRSAVFSALKAHLQTKTTETKEHTTTTFGKYNNKNSQKKNM